MDAFKSGTALEILIAQAKRISSALLQLGNLAELVLDGTRVQRISESIAHLPLAGIVQQTLLIRIHHLGAAGPHAGVGVGRAALQRLPLRRQLPRVDLLSLPLGIVRHRLIAAHGVDLFVFGLDEVNEICIIRRCQKNAG